MTEAVTKARYGCVPFSGSTDGKRFYVTCDTADKAVSEAKQQARELGHKSVFVEDKKGKKIYEDSAAE